jgi:secondary thiamine-phosphate synthase enzyme
MKYALSELRLATAEPIEVLDITDQVRGCLEKNPVRNGFLTLISNHTTAFVNLNERETNLQRDMVEYLSKIAPQGAGYSHDVSPVDGRANAHAHLAGLFMNASETIPIVDGRLLLGRWQSVLFVELDGPRQGRSVHVYIVGDDG